MNRLENLIADRGKDFNYCFVFPNNISQQFCFARAISLLKLPTVPSECYVSWHTFIKEHVTNSFDKKQEEAGGLHRLLYAEYIMAQNEEYAKDGKPLFKTLISPKYADKSHEFSKWISSILPQLALFIDGRKYKDEELKDLSFLCSDYAQFLRNNSLFEPCWEPGNFIADGKKYIIIYPELIDDFGEYQKLFENRIDVEFFSVGTAKAETLHLREFENSPCELKYVASEIEELILNGEKISNIALSVADIEHLQSHILQEFEKRGIPIDLYTTTPILQNSFVMLFETIRDIVESHYSFDSVKKLLLNKAINWKFLECEDFIKKLIQFGIEYNCAYSWQEKNTWQNVWEKAFYGQATSALYVCFKKLREKIEAIYKAASFEEMERAINVFFSEYIDFSNVSKINERAISIYYKTIKDLKVLEAKFGEYLDKSKIVRYNFFIAVLQTKTIHSEVLGTALSVFPYGAACATFFSHHFVLNMNQKSSSIARRKLHFLREDKRAGIGIKDVDLGQYFIASYSNMEHIYFSYSKKTYEGYCIANSSFGHIEKIENMHVEDSFYNEECYFFALSPITQIYKTQLCAIQKAKVFDFQPKFSLLAKSYKDGSSNVLEKIVASQYMEIIPSTQTEQKDREKKFSVSATKLDKFFLECPAKFFFSDIMKIRKLDFTASLFDRRVIGRTYHLILEMIYKKIMSEYTCFDKSKIDDYKRWMEEIFQDVVRYNSNKYGPLSAPFMHAMQKQIEGVVEYVFALDAKLFNNCEQYIIEGEYNRKEQKSESKNCSSQFFEEKDDILYVGRIDRAVKTEGGFAIIDYKTYAYSKDASCLVNDIKIKDFQMPFYVFLLEEKLREKNEGAEECKKVELAYFVELLKKDCNRAIKNVSKDVFGKTGGEERADFEKKIEAFKFCAKEFKEKVLKGDFVPEKDRREQCNKCEYKHICRTTFLVGARRL